LVLFMRTPFLSTFQRLEKYVGYSMRTAHPPPRMVFGIFFAHPFLALLMRTLRDQDFDVAEGVAAAPGAGGVAVFTASASSIRTSEAKGRSW
jgi:hypothetical protein